MNIIETILSEEPFQGEDGKLYKKVIKELRIPRKTFMRGTIEGKYRGDLLHSEEKLYNSSFYDFEIYEAQVSSSHPKDFQKNKEFTVNGKAFPKEKLPLILLVELNANSSSFGINILEPKLYEFKPIAKFHQTEGDEVFGCFKGKITGYVLDYEKEIVEEVLGPYAGDSLEKIQPESIKKVGCESSGIKTGKTVHIGNYIQYEYKCKNHNDTVWGEKIFGGNPKINGFTNISSKSTFGTEQRGCFSEFFGLLAIILGFVFVLSILPGALYVIGLGLVILLLNYFAPFLKWVFRILSCFLLIGFVIGLFNIFFGNSTNYNPVPKIVDSPRETEKVVEPIVDHSDLDISPNEQENLIGDSIITRFRSWQDYEGNKYEGEYKLKLSSYKKSNFYKQNLQSFGNDLRSYDKILYSLKENDKDKLDGLYALFDSIGRSNKLNKMKFAEMVVAFVQDIPYALVLETDCNPSLYNDPFIKKYLSSKNADCYSFQKFGINAPVEFLVNLKGDCDTRTLLLYTVLSHYGYDVALMSSEQYSHSILGINLPFDGLSFKAQNQNYTLWETTSPNNIPGIIASEISNLNNWRISLKSK
ncbi:hypothetical protein ACFPVY_00765 [Flavobacterium qiangtangense]|uniref:Transglutaminase superfamily protein n=1 Tax=Flavobacterium qiangtangense TaxID=1442595 RepID=A0ABW1PJZ1_9FLAO